MITIQWNTTLLLPQIDWVSKLSTPRGNISLQKIPTLLVVLSWVDCVCWTCNYKVYNSTWRQYWLQWTGEIEAGSRGALPVWLTFSCTLRLSITPLLLWLKLWTDSTLWFYAERMQTHCGSFSPLISVIVLSRVWYYLLYTLLFFLIFKGPYSI